MDEWMCQCLNYLKWYHLTALSPWVTLEELFSGPVVSHSWRMVAVDEDLVRFSLEVVYRSFESALIRLRAGSISMH